MRPQPDLPRRPSRRDRKLARGSRFAGRGRLVVGIILASAAGALGMQLGGTAAPGVTPDRSKTFSAGGPGLADAAGSTAGDPVQPGHLHSVVGLVWRSVVLWMLLVALLTLANVLG